MAAKCTGTRTDFVKKVGIKLEKWLDELGNPKNKIPALKAIYERILEKESKDDINSFVGDRLRSELFKEAMITYYNATPEVIFSTFKSSRQKPLSKEKIDVINVKEYLDNEELFREQVQKVIDFDDFGTDVVEDIERTIAKGLYVGDVNLDVYDSLVFSAINMRIPAKGPGKTLQTVLSQASNLTRDGFYEWLEKEFPYDLKTKEGFNKRNKWAVREILKNIMI